MVEFNDADKCDHVIEDFVRAVNLKCYGFILLEGRVDRPFPESLDQARAEHLVVLRRAQHAFGRVDKLEESIVRLRRIYRLAVDSSHGPVRKQRELGRLDIRGKCPTLLDEPLFPLRLGRDVFRHELLVRHVLERAHVRQRTDCLLREPVQETGNLLRIRIAG